MAKKAEIEEKEGASLPLARTTSLATPSPRGKAPKTPIMSREFCETKLDSERKRTTNAPEVASEIEAPYELPEGWKWYRGCELFSPMERTQPSGDFFNYIDIESVDNQNQTIRIPKKVATTEAPSRASRKLHVGDTVFSMVRPYLKNIAYIDASLSDSIASTGFYVCTPREFVDSRYIYNLMKSPYVVDGLNLFMKGDNSPSIRSNDIEQFLFPIPPTLAEQQRIVNRIESMFAKLDEAKEKAQNVVDSFETRKAAILHQAFTGNLTAKWRKENGISDDSWEEKILGEMLFPMTSKIPSGETFRYIDIDAIDNANQIVESPKLIEVSNAPSRASRGLMENDVLFSMVRPYLKNIAVIDVSLSDCIASTGFYVCRCKPELNHLYLYNLLCSKDAIDYLMQFMKGDNSPSIRKDDLLGMMINLPSIPEQQEIVRILDSTLEKERTANSAAEQVLEQIDLLKKSILARAFRGEL